MNDILGRAAREAFGERGSHRRCTATNRDGKQCGRAPIPGGFVCNLHGGSSPQARRAARARLNGMVDLALNALEVVLTTWPADASVIVRAAQVVLDRARDAQGSFGPNATVTVQTATMDYADLPLEELIEHTAGVLSRLMALQQQQQREVLLLPPAIEGEVVEADDVLLGPDGMVQTP